MSAETGFIGTVATHLSGFGSLTPAPARVGAAEPLIAAELPALVLSIESVARLGAGLGERAAVVTHGALPVTSRVDLSNPVLPAEPAFRLLSDDRRTLVMPHGGWVRSDGSSGPVGPADLQVSVAAAPRAVVQDEPAAAEVRPDPEAGTLTFGAPLPASGTVLATYVLGQWERRATLIAGVLRIDVRAVNAADVTSLTASVIDALDDGAARPRGLRRIALGGMSSVGLPAHDQADSRSQTLRYAFEYEHEVNRPDSSGGVIRRIPIATRLEVVGAGTEGHAAATTLDSETEA